RVERRLAAGIGLRKRDLPEEDADAAPVQLVDEPFRVGPRPVRREGEVGEAMGCAVWVRFVLGAVEGCEGRLVRPCLDDDGADGDVLGLASLDLGGDALLGVPLVAAEPEAEHPVGERSRPSDQVEELLEHPPGIAFEEVEPQARLGRARVEGRLDGDAVGAVVGEVESRAMTGVEEEAEVAADDDSERHREVAALALALVLVEDRAVDTRAAQLDAVEAFAEADDSLAFLEAEGEAGGVDEAPVGEERDAARQQAVGERLRAGDLQRPRAGVPDARRDVEPLGRLPIGAEAVAERLARRESRDVGAPGDRSLLGADGRRLGEMAACRPRRAGAPPVDLGGDRSPEPARLDGGHLAAPLELECQAVNIRTRHRPQGETSPGEGMDRVPLIWFVEIRMSAACGSVADHAAPSRTRTTAHVSNAGKLTVSEQALRWTPSGVRCDSPVDAVAIR